MEKNWIDKLGIVWMGNKILLFKINEINYNKVA